MSFALYDSDLTQYDAGDVVNRALVGEITDTLSEQGLKVGFYHSLIDWHHPQYDFTRSKQLPCPKNGPKGDGTIPKERADVFSAIGKWMGVNFESILRTTASPVAEYSLVGRITSTGMVHDLSVFKRPDNGMITMPFAVKQATLLTGGNSLKLSMATSETSIELPAELPAPVAAVIRLG